MYIGLFLSLIEKLEKNVHRIVSKFNREVREECTFCQVEIESISHLFYECRIVNAFILEVYSIFIPNRTDIRLIPAKKDFILDSGIFPSSRLTIFS